MRDTRHAEKRGTRGSVTIMVTISLFTMFGLMALVFDVGYGYYIKQTAQAAADAAALAAVIAAKPTGSASIACGTTVICQFASQCPSSPQNVTNFGTGCMYAKQNGFTNSGNQTVTISGGLGNPPSVAGLSTANYWAQVETRQTIGVSFLTFLNAASMDVRARATAVLTGMGDQVCVYVMDPSASGAASFSGGADLETTCGMYVNSNSGTALTSTGSAHVVTTVTDVVGGYSTGGSSTFVPLPTTGSDLMDDPLASLPAPTYSGCDHTGFASGGGTITLNPGVYCDGISITNGTANFNPGTYILNGGGLTISGSSNVYGSGVMFYNTASGYLFKPINIQGGTYTNLTAQTSGTYLGILFFQDRSITSTTANSISGGSNLAITGTIYMPTGLLSFSGGSSTIPLMSAIVCQKLSISGGAFFQLDPTGEKTGIGKIAPALVQ